jgi:hypothetical protein
MELVWSSTQLLVSMSHVQGFKLNFQYQWFTSQFQYFFILFMWDHLFQSFVVFHSPRKWLRMITRSTSFVPEHPQHGLSRPDGASNVHHIYILETATRHWPFNFFQSTLPIEGTNWPRVRTAKFSCKWSLECRALWPHNQATPVKHPSPLSHQDSASGAIDVKLYPHDAHPLGHEWTWQGQWS